jgi:predicted nuclease of restriction endonuclease-like (RecB) superfamily
MATTTSRRGAAVPATRGGAVREGKARARALPPDEQQLFERVVRIVEQSRAHVSRTVNTAMVHAYWLIGREIVEVEQQGQARATYGDRVMERLTARLQERFGDGFSLPTVKRMRQFFQCFPKGSALLSQSAGGDAATDKGSATLSLSARPLFPPTLSWTHYVTLMRVERAEARAFYEIECSKKAWSTRELERQMASLLYERLANSTDRVQVRALSKRGQRVEKPQDVLKDPMVLEFLDLKERGTWLERDLEQALIDRLEGFLLELGKGFCFVARQRRMTLDGDHFYVDLVFYNRLLRCFVLVDLKLGKLTHQDLGQMQMYVNWFDQFQRQADFEAPTIGIVLCSEKNEAMVRITLPKDSQVLATRYQLYLPTEEELRAELFREREAAERALRA